MKLNDDLLERLGTYFVYHDVLQKYQMTFERFIDLHERGLLSEYIN